MSDEKADVALFQETWFSSENSASTAKIKNSGFDIKHTYREKRGAGVAVVYRKGLNPFSAKCGISGTYSSFQHQCLILNLSPKIHFINIYRYQEIPLDTFVTELENLLEEHTKYSHSLILAGDFNVHFEKIESNEALKLQNVTTSFGLQQHVIGSTHRLGHTLDLIFCNPFELNVTVTPVLDYCISDHFPVLFKLNNINGLSKSNSPKRVTYRNIKGVNVEEFKSDLTSQFGASFNDESLEFSHQYQLFKNITNNVLDKFAPQKSKIVVPKVVTPWIDAEYRTERALRRKLERQWKKAKNKEGIERTLYVNQRKKCASLSSTKRSQYYTHLIKDCKDNQSSLFKVVSQVLDKNKHSGLIPQYEKNHKTLANDFNNYYVNKVTKIRNEIPYVDTSDLIQEVPFEGTVLSEFTPTSVEELRTVIKQGEIKTAFNDVLPRELMKSSFEVLLPYICTLVNTSLATGCVEGIKESTIMPLLKKSGLDPEILKHYRPVSDIVLISKIIEKIVLLRLNAHERSNNLQCHYQHGYKKFHNTETFALIVVNDVLIGFDKNSGTILILLDLSAAFDTVDIKKLLSILDKEFGIRGTALKWFQSFLVGRKQRVRIGSIMSDYVDVAFGVPQGSVLGPVLFNIYTRSLYTLINKAGFRTSGYADDSNARQTFSLAFQYNIITSQVPSLLDKITKWMHTYFLKINPDKTEIILFTPDSKVNTINGVILSNGDCIRFSNYVKNLGVTFDKSLNMETHINSVVSHSYKLIKDVRDVRNLLSKQETEQLVHAIISNRLDYCNSLFFGLNKSVLNKLQKVQNAAARLIVQRKKCESIRNDIINLHWLRINERIVFKILITVFKCLHDMAPFDLCTLLDIKDPQNLTLNYVFMNSSFGQRSFSYIAPKLWNQVPQNLRLSPSLNSFKSQLKTFLFKEFSTYMNRVNRYNN